MIGRFFTETTRLDAREAVLIVVDMQERIMPAMAGQKALIDACGLLIRGCRILDLPVIFTQQYTTGLGLTIPEIVAAATDDGASGFSFIEKTSFSVLGEPGF
ncbi:MAG: isochorismatase family protein, partial [Clostridiales Family XIII bacterium]|nr:isochorismatase family protein [Clostridiales Family XIII bacterium]